MNPSNLPGSSSSETSSRVSGGGGPKEKEGTAKSVADTDVLLEVQ